MASDCPGSDSDCQTRTCTAGRCGVAFAPQGTAAVAQTAGDCQQQVCDGQGGVTSVPDDADLPSDSNPCTQDLCQGGVPSHPPAPGGTACGPGGQLACDGSGTCVGCASDADCGVATACTSFSCDTGTGLCSPVYTPDGQGDPGGQVAGDCQRVVCNGQGGIAVVADDSDLPPPAGPCRVGTCASGTPGQSPAPQGTGCSDGGTCTAAGSCAFCQAASDCGADTACTTYACTDGACQVSYVPAGQGSPAGTVSGSCMRAACDGQGSTTQVADDTNVPDDNNPCTLDACASGAPSHTPVASGTGCGPGLECDGAGGCVGCLAAAECGTSSACVTFLCETGSCAAEYTPSGLACADDSDPCTSDLCDGTGNCTHPRLPAGSACADGQVCDASGACAPACFIGGTLYASGAANPANACQLCTPATSTSAWTNQADGTGCNDANPCTASDVCTGGVCGGAAYACTAGDCQASATCDGDGGCTVTNQPSGDPCADDGNPCTGDLCNGNGACTHPAVAAGAGCGAGQICNASGSCVAGCFIGGAVYAGGAANPASACQVCNPAASTTAWTDLANGTTCSDGNACTQTDTCQAGVCAGSNPVTCAALDQCHRAGACDPATGLCSNPSAPNDSACDDGNPCTQTDTCQGGACSGSNPVTCTASDACHLAGTCDPATGVCSNPSASDGAACSAGGFSGSCRTGVCETCGDGVLNGTETDLDCGGSCPGCANGKACAVGGDCAGGICSNGVCKSATCSDGAKNGAETDIDCGGGTCPACAAGKSCSVGSDCAGGACTNGVCGPACLGQANDAVTGQKCPIKTACTTYADCGTQVTGKYWYCSPTTQLCEFLPQTNGFTAASGTCTGQLRFRQDANAPWDKKIVPPDGVNFREGTTLAIEVTNTTAGVLYLDQLPLTLELGGTSPSQFDVSSIKMYQVGSISDYGDGNNGTQLVCSSPTTPFGSGLNFTLGTGATGGCGGSSFARIPAGGTTRFIIDLAFSATETYVANRQYRLRLNSNTGVKARTSTTGASASYTACSVPTVPVLGSWLIFKTP